MASALADELRRVSEVALRAAAERDLGVVNTIFAAAQTGDGADAPRAGLPIFRHELATAEMWVAERAGEVIGFAAAIHRGGRAFLAELFVRADLRSRGVGRSLVARGFADRGLPRATLGSSDPRALALYVTSGLEPRWPLFYLVAERSRRRHEPTGIERHPASPDELAALDAELGGRARPQDLDYWRSEGSAELVTLRRGGATLGYGVVRRRSDDWIGHESATTIGPAAVRDSRDATAGLFALLDETADLVRIAVPGPHPALPALLRAGFTIAEVDTFLATPGDLGFDPRGYVPSGGALF